MPSMSFDSAEVPLTHPNEFNISELDLHKNDLNTSKSDQLLLKRFRSCVLCLLLGLAAISYGLFIFSPNPANSLFSHVKTDTFSISGRKHSNGDYFLGIPYAIGHPFMNAHGYKYKLPVVVYFTAGDTQTSSLSDFVPSVVIKQYACRGVVVVYVNYRVNMFGFFSTGTPGSGNVALYDAKLALEWVRTHIEHFGGNSRDVTVIGTAMGARIVSLMGRIPRIRHLYHKAILLSGSSFVPFMVQDFAYGQHRSRHLALSHNCANDQNWPVGKVPKHPVHIVKCLRSSNISNNIYMNEKNLLPWHFMIDDDLVGPDLADPTNMLGLSVPLLSIACLEKPLSPSHKIPLHTVQAAIKEVKQLGNRQLKSFREYYLNLYSKNGSLQNGTNIGISNKEVQNGIFDDFLITGPSLMEAQATAERNMLTYLVTVYGRKVKIKTTWKQSALPR
uniref:COesterase domain-containing protein n=1 Tax=Panagrellus redivivus TaxID=6233 RepID=A0A7E4VVU7_PANRE